jgi:cell wall assembly regulator SMI1
MTGVVALGRYGPLVRPSQRSHGPTPVKLSVDLLEQLADRWRKRKAPILDHLLPGLTTARMDAITEPLGFQLSDEARTWWGWHDGTNPDLRASPERDLGVGALMAFTTLSGSFETYRQLRRTGTEVWGPATDRLWPPTWIPISAQMHGDVVVCDCGVGKGELSRIYVVAWDDPSREPAAASFGDMVCDWIEAIDSGRWYYEPTRRQWYLDDSREPKQRILV